MAENATILKPLTWKKNLCVLWKENDRQLPKHKFFISPFSLAFVLQSASLAQSKTCWKCLQAHLPHVGVWHSHCPASWESKLCLLGAQDLRQQASETPFSCYFQFCLLILSPLPGPVFKGSKCQPLGKLWTLACVQDYLFTGRRSCWSFIVCDDFLLLSWSGVILTETPQGLITGRA